jgi:hypothetical protein
MRNDQQVRKYPRPRLPRERAALLTTNPFLFVFKVIPMFEIQKVAGSYYGPYGRALHGAQGRIHSFGGLLGIF